MNNIKINYLIMGGCTLIGFAWGFFDFYMVERLTDGGNMLSALPTAFFCGVYCLYIIKKRTNIEL